ncbi:MAG: DUF308 domain-containing protein, partial [Rikenellaceae bacterium]
ITLIILGCISISSYIRLRKSNSVVATAVLVSLIAAIILGVVLVSKPIWFTNILMYLLGFLAVAAAAIQIYTLGSDRGRGLKVPIALFIVPILLFVTGALIIFNPFDAASLMVVFFGASAIVYGVIDLINNLIIKKKSDPEKLNE